MWKVENGRRARGGWARPSDVAPGRQPEALKGSEGYWLALKEDKVVAAAQGPRELAAKIRLLGTAGAYDYIVLQHRVDPPA